MPELIDVLDENGVKTGRIATREEIHRDGLWHRCIVVAILNDKNEILLQQRSHNKKKNPGMWDISVAGHVDAGESSESATWREINEEIGTEITQYSDERHLHFVTNERREESYRWNNTIFIDRTLFDCFILIVPKIDINKLKLQASEVQAAKLCSLNEFEQMLKSGLIVKRPAFYNKLINFMKERKWNFTSMD